MRLRDAFAPVLLLGLCACTKSAHKAGEPEAVLERYVDLAFSAKSPEDGRKLVELSTGAAKEWLSSMSESEFEKHFVKNGLVFLNLKMRDKREDKDGNVSLVYELSFRDGKGPEPLFGREKPPMTPSPASYTTKKIAYLKKENGEWKISATKNVKSVVERKEDLEILTPETTDKGSAGDSK